MAVGVGVETYHHHAQGAVGHGAADDGVACQQALCRGAAFAPGLVEE